MAFFKLQQEFRVPSPSNTSSYIESPLMKHLVRFLIGSFVSVTVNAQIIPQPSYDIHVWGNNDAGTPFDVEQSGLASGRIVLSDPFNGFVVGRISVFSPPEVSYAYNLFSTTANVLSVNVYSELRYSFAILGPSGPSSVPTNIASSDFWSFSGSGETIGNGTLNVKSDATSLFQRLYTGSNQNAGSNSYVDTIWLNVGEVYDLELIGYSSALTSGAGSYLVGGATLDPYIFVDPGFSQSALYSVVVSPGVGNSPSAVPEPSTFTIYGTLLICLTASTRGFCRSRQKNAKLTASC